MTPDDLPPDAEARLAAALRAVDSDHAAGRDRLLAALAGESAGRAVPSSVWRKGSDMLRRHAGRGALAAGLAAALVVGLLAVRPPGALAATAEAIRAAGGFRCTAAEVDFPHGLDAPGTPVGTLAWTPAGTRLDEVKDGRPHATEIDLVGRPGLALDHPRKQFRRTAADQTANPLLRVVGGLADARGRGAEPLGGRTIDGVRTVGYDISLDRLDDRLPAGRTLEVWFDPATKRPVRLVLVGLPGPGKALRLDGFEWAAPADLFDPAPPEGYADATPVPPTDDQVTEWVVFGLRYFADHAGHYPRVKNVYGDEQADELARLTGRPSRHMVGRIPIDPQHDPANPDDQFSRAAWGLSWINHLQRKNPDPAYHGRTVAPGDGGKVLVRWRLDSGDYRVIFGDLEVLTVSADRLKQLEK